jgi:hypothetical protein
MALTKTTTWFGDTREHETIGFPPHDNDGAVDAYVEVAQRPSEQPLFGRRVLEWVLTSQTEPAVHLGDLLDMSWQSEIHRIGALFSAVQPKDLDGEMKLSRERTQFVGTLNTQPDKLESPRIRNYMPCRAVVGAKANYEVTRDDKRAGRSDEGRRKADSFSIEATVGMD